MDPLYIIKINIKKKVYIANQQPKNEQPIKRKTKKIWIQ